MKIEEMAKFQIAGRLLGGNESSLRIKEFRELGMDAYTNGANAILKEIENILSLEYNTMTTVDLIVEKVKELKG